MASVPNPRRNPRFFAFPAIASLEESIQGGSAGLSLGHCSEQLPGTGSDSCLSRAHEAGRAKSERVLQRELQNPRADIAQNLPECRIREVVIRCAEVDVVHQVEEFEAQLDAMSLGDVEIAAHRSININISWREQGIPA